MLGEQMIRGKKYVSCLVCNYAEDPTQVDNWLDPTVFSKPNGSFVCCADHRMRIATIFGVSPKTGLPLPVADEHMPHAAQASSRPTPTGALSAHLAQVLDRLTALEHSVADLWAAVEAMQAIVHQ